MSEATTHPSPIAQERSAEPSPTLAYGGMGAGPAFGGKAPGEVPAPTIMAVNANSTGQRKIDVATVLAEPLRASGSKTWWESPQGRMGTRLITRGLFGSIAYALATMAIDRAMQRYTPHAAIDDGDRYENANSFHHRFIRGCAKFLDQTVGRAIGGTFGHSATVFRPTRFFGRTKGVGDLTEVPGRSLGHEYVDVVFNFAAASMGDSMGRNIAGLIDPHKKVSWLEGGKFDLQKFAVSQCKALWKTVSYAAGEDFVVGLPYMYLMKAQRKIIDKISPGFKYVFDYGNSDAYKVKDGKITGSYYWENVVDYQLRFSNYNVMTLMFRETYNSVGDRINAWFSGEKIEKPESDKPKGNVFQRSGKFVKDLGRYIVHSGIKGYIMMTPTVPFFSLLRIPQAKRGPFGAMAIDQTYGPIMIDQQHLVSPGLSAAQIDELPKFRTVRPLVPDFRRRMEDNTTDGHKFYKPDGNGGFKEVPGKTMQLHYLRSGEPGVPTDAPNVYAKEYQSGNVLPNFNPYDYSQERLKAGKWSVTNMLGRAGELTNQWGGRLYSRVSNILHGNAKGSTLSDAAKVAREDLRVATGAGANAALPYTTYFMIKTETHQRDTPEMDRQIDKVQDGIAHLDGKTFVEGIKGIAKEFMHPSKNTGVGSVFGRDNADTTDITPWSKRVGSAQTNYLERVAANTGVPVSTNLKPSTENWRDRRTETATTNPSLS